MDYFEQFGKMPVVIGVVCIILLGVIAYLSRLDFKISRMERKINEQEQQLKK
jgi:uncharacterized membrane protein YciS (DUF1049 family)